MRAVCRWWIVCAALCGPAAGQNAKPPVTLVAPTDKLSPEQQRATFKLPPGFEIQLVAAEPDIAKPMNIAFDDRGRLWVTDTVEYPWPAEPGKGRDSVKVLSNFDENGRARTVTTFASGLNIPLGILPIETNETSSSAIVYSIPEIRRYDDTDGDGRSDRSKTLLRGFGSVDTHGMTNNFVRGFDGYVYANHGFRNDSVVVGTDGSTITMNSGNTYRFKPDGSKVQLFARGQVNPFGLAFDEWGNLFSADCHTRPQYLLLRGAVYPSFGKPDDGLGFGPEMCPHSHGSTGIAGTMVYAADQFPEDFRGNLFNGNPVTNTINRDKIKWTGSTPLAVEQPDFLTSSDPWFRPVQVKLGPDGAMYIADFYNKIIGHYEVDLKHPGRDRTSGRIWRIVYKGDAAKAPAPTMPDMAKMSPKALVELLGHPNLAVRMLVTDRLADGETDPVTLLRQSANDPTSAARRVSAMWVLSRRGRLTADDRRTFIGDPSPLVRVQSLREISEVLEPSDAETPLLRTGLTDEHPSVRRAAAEAQARHPGVAAALSTAADDSERRWPGDTHLHHAMKIALRERLTDGEAFKRYVQGEPLQPQTHVRMLDAALGVPTPEAAAFIAATMNRDGERLGGPLALRALRHAIRYAADDKTVATLIDRARDDFAKDPDLQLDAIESLLAGTTARGKTASPALVAWAEALVTELLTPADTGPLAWSSRPVDPTARKFTDPWTPQSRKCADGKSADFWSSLPKGETLTGVLRSSPFAAPATLSLWTAGHNGLPSSKDPVKNLVRLLDAATGEVLAEAPAARNDTAQKTTWNLAKLAGRQVVVEAIDADTRTAYAWIAFGRFEPAVVSIPAAGQDVRKRLARAVDLAGAMKLRSAADPVLKLLASASTDPAIRAAAAKAIAAIDPAAAVQAITRVVGDPAAPAALRDAGATALGTLRDPAATEALLATIAAAPQTLQRTIALSLSGTKQGAEGLLTAGAAGKASPRLLTDRAITDKLRAAGVDGIDAQLATLTKGLPDVDAAVQKLIDDRRGEFAAASGKASAERGKAVFMKNCAACHRVGDEGAQVGPQLDGLGKRGVDRTIEDILDPSRNVDGAFRYSVLTLDDGDVVTGLQRRVDGQTTVFADAKGAEFSVETTRIRKRTESQLSLMPANWGDVMTKEEFVDLLAFLMAN